MTAPQVFFPPFRLDLANDLLWREEQLIPLRPKAVKMLRFLIERPGQVATREEILRAVWSKTVVSAGGLKVCMREIRKALGDNAETPQFIETVPGRGYRFIALLSLPPPVIGHQLSVISKQKPATSSQLATGNWQLATRLVGREAELARLHKWLEKALAGERQIVFVTGEPGIGKTTLVEVFLASLSSGSSLWIARGQCVEHYGAGEPYMPVLEAVERLCLEPDREWFLSLLRQHAPLWLAQMPALLSHEERVTLRSELTGMTPERMLREMASLLETLTGPRLLQGPPLLVLVIEDLHWSDVSTVELLARLARRQEFARLLFIGTYRPVEVLASQHPLHGLVQELQGHNLCKELPLTGFAEAAVSAYLQQRFVQQQLPRQLPALLCQHTEGNPLLLASVVEEWLAQGILLQEAGVWTLPNGLAGVKRYIPHNVRQLLAKQFERLTPETRQIVVAASVAGVEFSTAAVAATVGGNVAEVEACCEDLARQQQFLRQIGPGTWPDGTVSTRYGFRHALAREAIQERIPLAQRQRLHQQIGERIELAYGSQVDGSAAELAVHFAEARDYPRAVQYHRLAGEKALQRFAYAEAIEHLIAAVGLLEFLPASSTRTHLELEVQLTLGGSLSAAKGWAATETGKVYARALELAKQGGSPRQIFLALFGSWVFAYTRADLRTAHALAKQLLQLAQDTQERSLLMEAHHALGNTLQRQGELEAARFHLEQGIALYDRRQHTSQSLLYGLDDGVAGLGYDAWVLWGLGLANQALRRTREMVALARKIAHPLSQAWALNSAAWHHQFRREPHKAQEWAAREIALCTEYGFAQLLAVGTIVHGWALAVQGQAEDGVRQMREGMAAVRSTGTEIGHSRYLAVLAEVYGELGQTDDGLSLLHEAMKEVERTGERFYEAELYRLKGALTLRSKVQGPKSKVQSPKSPIPGTQAEADAERCFHQAIDVARRQQAKSLELRAVASLSRLWQSQGQRKKARRALATVCDWFTEGFDTSDLRGAKALLDELT
jgi:predicted ATPase/DNA-binding winged helix-turn-helix (wHTH) protein